MLRLIKIPILIVFAIASLITYFISIDTNQAFLLQPIREEREKKNNLLKFRKIAYRAHFILVFLAITTIYTLSKY